MKIETASPADAPEISSLIVELSAPFYLSPNREGAERFLAAISTEALRGYVSADNFSYCIARLHTRLAGVVALRDNSHLFHLFVAPPFQGQGLGRQLWSIVKTQALLAGNPGAFTVNSSLNAVPVYERFGFTCNGPPTAAHGIAFQPMRMALARTAPEELASD